MLHVREHVHIMLVVSTTLLVSYISYLAVVTSANTIVQRPSVNQQVNFINDNSVNLTLNVT